jgi:hypothetical protein
METINVICKNCGAINNTQIYVDQFNAPIYKSWLSTTGDVVCWYCNKKFWWNITKREYEKQKGRTWVSV